MRYASVGFNGEVCTQRNVLFLNRLMMMMILLNSGIGFSVVPCCSTILVLKIGFIKCSLKSQNVTISKKSCVIL